MAILSKGATIVADTQVSATNLNNLVDAATFVSGAVDGTTTQLSSGAIIVKDGGITPAKISTGGPSWTSGGTVSATAFSGPLTGAVTGNSSTATALATARTIAVRARVSSGQVVGSVVDAFPGAAWHERELAEMFGVELSSGPAEHLLLAEGGPEHPLLKSFSLIAEPKAR